MHQQKSSASAVTLASLAAGPLVVLALVVMAVLAPDPPLTMDPWDVAGVCVLAMFVGFLPAILLNWIGSALMRSVQSEWPLARSPAAWALSGLLLMGVVTFILSGPQDTWSLAIFCPAGAGCAMICWHFQRKTSPAA